MIDEYKDLQKQFNDVIEWSQNFTNIKSDELFEKWYEHKKYFIDHFGGLIWESPDIVSFHLNEEEKFTKINCFIDEFVLGRYKNYDLAHFIIEEKDGFFTNIVTKDYEYQSASTILIPKGMKLLRAFKFFIKDDPVQLDFIQTKASALIQEDKIEGKFCLSVHPLDYLSSSENNYNWRSCHALDGEYRAGNLSYMADSDTIICYIKGEDNVILPHFPKTVPWNSKKWRMLLYVADEHNALMAGRQYPFDISGVLEYARARLFEKLGFYENRWSLWHHDIIRNYTFKDGTDESVDCKDLLVMGGKFTPRKELVEDKSSLHYNDLLYSSYYTPFYCWRLISRVGIKFSVGDQITCLSCGSQQITESDRMTCIDCPNGYNAYAYCAMCGGRYRVEDLEATESGDLLCPDCVEAHAIYCAHCGALIYQDDAWTNDDGEYLCYRCYRRRTLRF